MFKMFWKNLNHLLIELQSKFVILTYQASHNSMDQGQYGKQVKGSINWPGCRMTLTLKHFIHQRSYGENH